MATIERIALLPRCRRSGGSENSSLNIAFNVESSEVENQINTEVNINKIHPQ